MRRYVAIAVIAVLILALALTINSPYKPTKQHMGTHHMSEGRMITMGSAGRIVSFNKPPRRVVIFSSYWAEVTHCPGLDDKIVGIDTHP